MTKPAPNYYDFGPFRIDTVRRLLLRGTDVVPLPPKAYDTLLALVENSGRVVEKTELMTIIWPDSFVEEANLTQNISILRRVLGERAGEHRFIVTVPGRGYSFVATVEQPAVGAGDLIVERHAMTQVVATREEKTLAEDVMELAQRSAPVGLTQVKSRRNVNSVRLLLSGLAMAGLIAAVYYFGILDKSTQPQNTLEIKSIAVLPFKTFAEEGDEQYLGPGLADALITRIGASVKIKVRPTSSVMKYTGSEQDPTEAGRELGVEAVLDGRIQKSGDRVRVTIQLVRVSDGTTMWAAKFEDSVSNLFAAQDSISERMARELSHRLTGDEPERVTRRDTNPEAYRAYMRGRYWWNKRSRQAFAKAIDYFNQAIALDASYAPAYAGLADCYAIMSPNELGPPTEEYPKAKAAAKQALRIDDQLAEAHTSLAHITWLYEWNWAEAEREFKRAIDIHPNYPTARQWYSVYLSSMARHEEAIAQARLAAELDPVSIPISEDLARAFYHARQYDQAIVAALKTLELNPNYYRINGWLDMAFEQKGLYDQAVETRLKAMALVKVKQEDIDTRREAFLSSGWKGYWQKELEFAKQRAMQAYVPPYSFARTYARLGENEQALAWLEKAYNQRSDQLVLLKVDPIFDGLRGDARFRRLLSRIGFE